MMRPIQSGLYVGLLLLCATLTACGSSGHGEPPRKVSDKTIEQAMGIKPRPTRVRADQRVAARARPRIETPSAPAVPVAEKLTPSRPDAAGLPRRTPAETVPQMPAKPVEKVVKAPLPAAAHSGVVRIFLQSRDPQTGSRTFAISSDAVPEDQMMRVIPYLPALIARGTRMTGFAYINGTIVLAENCPDDPAQWGAECPSFLSTVEVVPDFGEGGREDFIPVAAAIEQLQDFERRMVRRLGSFVFVVCNEPLDRCAARDIQG